ncbi:Mitogen-activated protein kinase kinase kinase ANP1 [Diplonema papillatum]|nr:Mitogen-activated protein kinase kinase kinase ANP1 [Diplonema papillatum]
MAVKTIQFGTKDADVQHRIAMLANEIAVMKVLQHPNIVAYYFTERSGNAMNIFMEYVPGGSLLQLLKQFGPLGDVVASAYTEQILLGLAYLHRQGVVHRDIKCANILLTTEGLCKLADFGSAVQLSVVKQDSALRGTPVWMAPEVLMEQPHDWRCDIWSLGCTVMEMFTASLPFAHYNKSPLATLQAIVKDRLRLPDMLSKASKSFLTTCLVKKPELRPSAEDLIPHPWVQQDIDAIALNNKSDTMSCTSKLSRTSTVTSRCSARYVDALRGVPLKASEKEQEAMRKRRIGVLKADIEKRASLMQAPKNVSTVVTAKQFDVEELDPILKMVLGEKDAGEETVFAVSPKFHRLVSLSGTAATARHLVPADSNTSKTSA